VNFHWNGCAVVLWRFSKSASRCSTSVDGRGYSPMDGADLHLAVPADAGAAAPAPGAGAVQRVVRRSHRHRGSAHLGRRRARDRSPDPGQGCGLGGAAGHRDTRRGRDGQGFAHPHVAGRTRATEGAGGACQDRPDIHHLRLPRSASPARTRTGTSTSGSRRPPGTPAATPRPRCPATCHTARPSDLTPARGPPSRPGSTPSSTTASRTGSGTWTAHGAVHERRPNHQRRHSWDGPDDHL
jgi:hypothetical protein